MTDEYVEEFAQECEEDIMELNNGLLAFENDPADEAAMEQIFRTAHTLKGNCGAMGFDAASEIAHAIEDLLESIRANRVEVTPELMDAIFAGVDELEAAIEEAAEYGEIQRDPRDVIERLRSYADAPGLTSPTDREVADVLTTVSAPTDSEYSVYHVRLEVASDLAGNGIAVVDALDDAFDLLGTDPDRGAIADGDYDGVFDAVFASVVERAAVEAALDPVDAVANHVVSDVTDRVGAGGTAGDSPASTTADADGTATDASATDDADDQSASTTLQQPEPVEEDAEDLTVDELLEDDDVDQFDDLDGLAEEVGDVSEFDDLEDAGSFADLGVTSDDVGTDEEPAADATAEDASAAGDAAGSDSDGDDAQDDGADEPAEATDEVVQDATSEFEQLKEEVDPVEFDELQEEIEELEFDEYDSDDEVGFDELLGDEDLADEDAFGGPSESLAESGEDLEAVVEESSDDGSEQSSDVALEQSAGDDSAPAEATDESISPDEFDPSDALGLDDEPEDDAAAEDATSDAAPSEERPSATEETDDVGSESGESVTESGEPIAETDDVVAETDEPVVDDAAADPEASERDQTATSIADAALPDEAAPDAEATDAVDEDDRDADDVAFDDASETQSDDSDDPWQDATAAELFGQPEEVSTGDEAVADEATADAGVDASDDGSDATPVDATASESDDDLSVESAVDAGLDAAMDAEPDAEPDAESDDAEPEPATTDDADAVDDVDAEPAIEAESEPIADSESGTDAGPEVESADEETAADDAAVDSAVDADESVDDAATESTVDADDSTVEADDSAVDADGSAVDADDEPWTPEFEHDADVDFDDGSLPATEPEDDGSDEGVPVGSAEDLTDDSFGDVEAVDAPSASEAENGESEESEAVEGFGASDSVLDLGSGRSPGRSPDDEDDTDDLPVDGTSPVDDELPADAELPADEGASVDDETAVDDGPPVDEEDSVDEASVGEVTADDVGAFGNTDDADAFDHADDATPFGSDVDADDDEASSGHSLGSVEDVLGESTDDADDTFSDVEESTVAGAGADDEASGTDTLDTGTVDADADDSFGTGVGGVDDLLSSDDESDAMDDALDVGGSTASFGDATGDAGADDAGGLAGSGSPLDDPGFSDPGEEYGDAVVTEVDEDRLERIRTLGVPDRESGDGSSASGGQSIRVDVEQLDEMLNLVEGLVTSRARLRRALTENEPPAVLEEEIDDLEDVTSELQDTVMDVRLVPLRRAVSKLPRTVRDVAREQEKDVDFEIVGEDVELDRSILEEIGDPLVHLVRNAVDHGIEAPEERAATDKPETGSVELRARRERDRVLVTVEDDGRGIDPDDLRDAAVEEGIHSREEVEAMDGETALELVFHPGLSTAEEVTDVSGRGVGMDVVAETVESLDGSVSIDSEIGDGTTVELELPVTLAIAEMLFVEVGGEEYGIPVDVVDEIGPVVGVETQDGQEVLVSDGGEDERELVRLDDALETEERTDPGLGMLVHLRDDVREATLLCDDVRGQQEIVVKPFEGVLAAVPGLAGATVLGDGDVVNILDVETL